MAIKSSLPRGQRAHLDDAPPRTAPERNGTLPLAAPVVQGNGRAPLDPDERAKSGSAERRSKGGIEGLIGKRVAAATENALAGPNQTLMRVQKPV